MNKKRFRALLRRRFFVAVLLVIQLLLIAYTLVSRSVASTIISSFLGFLSLGACLYIISKKDKGAFKLTWVFLIMMFPLFGGLFYVITRLQTNAAKYSKNIERSAKKAELALDLAESCFEDACSEVQYCAPQIRYLQKTAGFPVYSDSSVSYLSPGEVKFDALLGELKKAEKYIFLEYFIIEEGKMWGEILEILREKAKAGVLVRVMYDDMGCFLKLPKNYSRQLESYGIECVVFNPFRPILTTVQNNRDHRKIAVIDGKTAFTGGINLADEYINEVEKFGHWKDAAVMLKGKAAWSMAVMFLQMWENCTGKDEDYTGYYPGENFWNGIKADGYVQPYSDSPMDNENVGEHVYLHMINRARDYIYINTPYLIIDDSMVSALCLAAKSGVDVRIVTPHRWDKRLVHMTTRSFYSELINSGVKVYEYSKGFIHSKTFVSDDLCASVGTINLDFRSLYLHFECGVWLCGGQAITDIKKDYIDTLKICRQISAEDCRCNVFMRLFREILRLFAPLM